MQRPIVVKLSRERSVGLSSALWKTADRIQMPFGIVGQTVRGMRQVAGFGDWSTERAIFGARHCIQWGLYVCNSATTRPFSQITLGRLVIIYNELDMCVLTDA